MGIRRFGCLKSARTKWALATLGLLGAQTCICPMDGHMEDRHTNEALSPFLALAASTSIINALEACPGASSMQTAQPKGRLIVLLSRLPTNPLSSRPPSPLAAYCYQHYGPLIFAGRHLPARLPFGYSHIVFQTPISPPGNSSASFGPSQKTSTLTFCIMAPLASAAVPGSGRPVGY